MTIMQAMEISVTDMHTGGEPVRIITGGLPRVEGSDILAKRRTMMERYDHIRRLTMLEPRGHADMYGAILVEPSLPEASAAVLFMHHEGYSTMCGHATIALGRYLLDQGVVTATGAVTDFILECPCGPVRVYANANGSVAFDSVPSFAKLDQQVTVAGLGTVTYDLGYGGAYYAILPASHLGLSMLETPIDDLRRTAIAITDSIRQTTNIQHEGAGDLGFLYGTILTDDAGVREASRNLCVFADGQIDRSPTGSGVTARMAVDQKKEWVGVGSKRAFYGLSDCAFEAEIVAVSEERVTVRVSGQGFYAGKSQFCVEDNDPLKDGFAAPKKFQTLKD